LASQSHKQNEVAKQLTIIATIFLPLTYITGFFGQNFGWMVNNITSPEIFWWLGIGSQIMTLAILFWFFKAKRWI
jgi:magnesium transporter